MSPTRTEVAEFLYSFVKQDIEAIASALTGRPYFVYPPPFKDLSDKTQKIWFDRADRIHEMYQKKEN